MSEAERPASERPPEQGEDEDGRPGEQDNAAEAQQLGSPQPAGSQEGEEVFVNHGLEVWLERQRQWRSEGSSEEAQRQAEESRKRKRSYAPTVTVSQLLSFQPLPHPVPLQEAVELLAELWESEEPF